MFFEISVKHTIVDKKGNDKEVISKYIVENQELFAEAEQKGQELDLNSPEVMAIKISPIREFVNKPSGQEGEAIYIATIVDTFINDDGGEKKTKYRVALYALSTTNANKIVNDYMAQGLDDMECEKIEKTSFVEVI